MQDRPSVTCEKIKEQGRRVSVGVFYLLIFLDMTPFFGLLMFFAGGTFLGLSAFIFELVYMKRRKKQ